MEDLKKWSDLTPDQWNAIMSFKPPKYYMWFYRWYKKWIGKTIFSLIVIAGILMLIFSDSAFDVVKGIFFGVFGLGLWALSAYLIKHFYTKKYAKNIGLTIEQWNYLTKGMTWN